MSLVAPAVLRGHAGAVDGPTTAPSAATRIAQLTGPRATVTWETVNRTGGIVFRLYRGHDTASMRLVWETAAEPGKARYRFHDVTAPGYRVYELRYVNAGGNEVSLGALHAVGSTWQAGDSPSDFVGQILGDRVTVDHEAPNGAERFTPRSPTVAATRAFAPPSPPPRAG